MAPRPSSPSNLRLAELVAALSLATDLGMGQPLEHGLRTCLIALELGRRLGLSASELAELYYVTLLRFVGCTADAHDQAALVGGDEIAMRAVIAPVLGASSGALVQAVMPRVGAGLGPLTRSRLVIGMLTRGRERIAEGMRAHCELADGVAAGLGLSAPVRAGLLATFEQWNGGGLPNRLAGEAIPISARIAFLARDAEVLGRQAGAEGLRAEVIRRRGRAYDPAVADAFLEDAEAIVAEAATTTPWEAVIAREPPPARRVAPGGIDGALTLFADFADLKSPFTVGHSRGVAALVAAAAASDDVAVRHAALIHDLGRVSVPNGLWEKPGSLSGGEWERVRLHPYYTERIVGRVPALARAAMIAGLHHERLDGSGYYRGSARRDLPPSARLLAAADAYQAMTQPRPHRSALAAERAAHELEVAARAGRLDPDAVADVLTAAGLVGRRVRGPWPAGLSDREVEVIGLICRGATKKEVAARLSISPATVDHHVRHIYLKVEVQTRAGLALFALRNGLLE